MLADSTVSRSIVHESLDTHVPPEGTDQTGSPAFAYRAGRPANGIQSRDQSVTRGRNIHGPSLSQAIGSSSRAPSAHPVIPEGEAATSSIALDTGLQRRISNRHNRQTSVINGLQHSRNPSFNSPLTASPLSPESLHNASLRNAAARRGPGYNFEMDSPPSSIAHSAHYHAPSIDSTLNQSSSHSGSNASVASQSTTSRGGRGHAQGSSINTQPDARTPSDYAMHHLLNAFFVRADQKIHIILAKLDTLPFPVEQTCGAGADLAFDQLLLALGHVTKHQPKPLIDSLMFWRQNKADVANNARKQLGSHRSPSAAKNLPTILPRRHTEPVQDPTLAHPGVPVNQPEDEEINSLDRQATVSIFILCRGLMEVFRQSTLEEITPELAHRLEGIVFEQLKAFEPHHLHVNKIRTANWKIYGSLLGQMSTIDFGRVTASFLHQLRAWQQDIAASVATTVKAREAETRIELLLSSMLHLQIGHEMLHKGQSIDFLIALAQSFANAHGQRIKQGYCAVLEILLLQLAGRPDLTENNPRFIEFTEIINSRINQMVTKTRHWASAVPICILLLCLSPLETFQATWLSQLNFLVAKLRERSSRTHAMRAICQLTYTYLNRTTDHESLKLKRVEEMVRLVLPPGRKMHVSTEASATDATLTFLRLVGMAFPDMCFRHAILPLISSEGMLATQNVRIEHLEPEKVTTGIKAFLVLIEDKEKALSAWPAFPVFSLPVSANEAAPASPMPFALAHDTDSVQSTKPPEFTVSTSPVNAALLDDTTRAYFFQICEMLGKIVVLCDTAFGSSAALNEKLSAVTPKTPIGEGFPAMRKEESAVFDQKVAFYELLNVAIKALPRCSLEHVPLNPLINLLCTASAHTISHIALAAARSLKAIAEQGYAQVVATAFPRFIFNYDHQYSTMSDEGRLGADHTEITLTLYLELLQIWIKQIQRKFEPLSANHNTGDGSAIRALQMEMTSLLSLTDEIEAYGLFFLCSQSRRVRSYAIKVLELVLQCDRVLGKAEQVRILAILQTSSEPILDLSDDSLTAIERGRLQKDRSRKGSESVLLELCSSENYYDSSLWFKAFPNVVRFVFETCPHVAALSRELVCDRLALMQNDAEKISSTINGSRDLKLGGRSSDTPVEVFLDQWKLYLIMACVTLSSTGGQTRGQLDSNLHTRKGSKNVQGLQDKLTSARALFSAVIPLLGSASDALRSAIVTALGSVNRKLYRILLESLQYAVITCNDEAKARRGAHQRTPSSPSRSQMTERMRVEVTCIYKLTASFLKYDDILHDEWILANLMNYAKELRLFLSDNDVHSDWKFSRLRYHYCGLVDVVFDNVKHLPVPERYMSFESRKSAFMLMEEWCGYQAEGHSPFWPQTEVGDKSTIAKEKISLRTAALSAMATLCAGPVSVITEHNTLLQFNLSRMLAWIDSVFTSREHKLHEIGQRALRNLIIHNANTNIFIEHAVQCCYGIKGLVALENCFKVIADVLMQQPQFPMDNIKVLGAVMFTLGHDSRDIRIRSARLLRFLDEREQKSSNLRHFDIRVSDKTRAVYKTAQFDYCRHLAQTHPDLAYHIFSEFCFQFRAVAPDIQRSMIASVLPWLQMLELQLIPEANTPTQLSYMLLVNLIEMTIRFGTSMHNEVEALWKALVTTYRGNVQLILDFIVNLSLDRREQNFVYCAKQIVVYLSNTEAGSRIFEHLLLQLAAKNMPNDKRSFDKPLPDVSQLPYVANLDTILPMGNRQATYSLGQISLILLVDLLVPPVVVSQTDALKILHAVFILWDHHTPVVQEHAREMLVHLMHTLVIAGIGPNPDAGGLKQLSDAEEIVEAIRSNSSQIAWSYNDATSKDQTLLTHNKVPEGMSHLAQQVIALFSNTFVNFSDAWAKEALHWASVCPVRHLACRSFQVFRCIPFKLDGVLLSDMLARLSNTIAEEQNDYLTFSLEILTTLKVVISGLDTRALAKFPQLVWTTVACLNTIHEVEFLASIEMLEQIATNFDFTDPSAVDVLLRAKPTEWEGLFEGIEPLVYKGLRSSQSYERTLVVMERFASFPDNALVGQSNRLLYTVLGYLPKLLESIKSPPDLSSTNFVANLATAARTSSLPELQHALENIDMQTSSQAGVLISSVLEAIKQSFFPLAEAEALIFVLGLLNNASVSIRLNVLEILGHLIPLVDMNNPKLRRHGADLISPLLRLLQTELCDQALTVMDHILDVNVTAQERHHIRMSMASGTSRAIRKEYENTESLYGIPEASGWSIPVPAVLAAQTRNNVHHVFFSCNEVDSAHDTPSQTPEVEFHTEDDYQDSYFPLQTRDEVYSSFDASHTDVTMGDIVSTLDSLDDFFEENDSPITPTGGARASDDLDNFAFFDSDHETNVYDQQTAPIISRSLNRTSSNVSFQNLADTRPPTSHYHRSQFSQSSAANTYQSSFSSIDEDDGPGPSLPNFDGRSPVAPQRPGMHTRSITSPANQYSASHLTSSTTATVPVLSPQSSVLSEYSSATEEILSDSENSPFPNLVPSISHGATRSTTVTPTSATTADSFMRRGMRRLTGGKSESAKEKARLRAPSSGQNTFNTNASSAPGQSPRMPRIPSEYLKDSIVHTSNPQTNTIASSAAASPLPMSPSPK